MVLTSRERSLVLSSKSKLNPSSRNRTQSIFNALEAVNSAERLPIACRSCARMASRSEILDRASMRSEDSVVNLSLSIVVTSWAGVMSE